MTTESGTEAILSYVRVSFLELKDSVLTLFGWFPLLHVRSTRGEVYYTPFRCTSTGFRD